MKITYDKTKNEKNIRERGLSFDSVQQCDWELAIIWPDTRKEYGEKRYSALLPRFGRIYAVTFTWRRGQMRIISFRKANAREVKRYEKEA